MLQYIDILQYNIYDKNIDAGIAYCNIYCLHSCKYATKMAGPLVSINIHM